ncbi:hypothetical protein [Burkholderia multivorans]|uniref:hypothetical protein n=1 Tax=Burkholderia multivorans TaxID=87883 RepID=UPI001C24CA7E|nr:hypothetical protein [Burkholderia multivorans]MBU9212292.1 hypothetical protein [Burkholderia multivorans]
MNTTELDLPVALANAPFDTVGKTVGAVVNLMSRRLRQAELEPEWVVEANWINDGNDSVFGLKADAMWPDRVDRDRLCLSVATGHSEGWIIQIDHVRLHAACDGGHWSSLPLMRIKTLTRSHAWAVAAAMSRILDID